MPAPNGRSTSLRRTTLWIAIPLLLAGFGAYCMLSEGHDSLTRLMHAAALGRVDTVQRLVDEKTPINVQDDDEKGTALMYAIDGDFNGNANSLLTENHEAAVKILIAAGADVNMRNRRGETALSKACAAYSTQLRYKDQKRATVALHLVALLLQAGADTQPATAALDPAASPPELKELLAQSQLRK